MNPHEEHPEKVMGVDRDVLFGWNQERSFQGFMSKKDADLFPYFTAQSQFRLRKTTSPMQSLPAEDDESFKQLIPYCVFRYRDSFYVMKRLPGADEKELHDKYTLGIGGHVNPDDLINGTDQAVETCALREFHEEVSYSGSFDMTLLGYINLEDSPVNRRHMGVVYLILGDNPNIEIKETNQLQGTLMTLDEIDAIADKLEGWSDVVFTFLKKKFSQRQVYY